jgi:hypothetical protein
MTPALAANPRRTPFFRVAEILSEVPENRCGYAISLKF